MDKLVYISISLCLSIRFNCAGNSKRTGARFFGHLCCTCLARGYPNLLLKEKENLPFWWKIESWKFLSFIKLFLWNEDLIQNINYFRRMCDLFSPVSILNFVCQKKLSSLHIGTTVISFVCWLITKESLSLRLMVTFLAVGAHFAVNKFLIMSIYAFGQLKLSRL